MDGLSANGELLDALYTLYRQEPTRVHPSFHPLFQDLEGEAEAKEPFTAAQKQKILEQLTRAELLESFLHMRYVGQKRFSLEGAETLIPMLKALIEEGGVEDFIIGMTHRGRLNVLCNIFNKPYAEVFAEFDEKSPSVQGSGDVKYHKGFSADVEGVHLILSPNPSHLEAVDPVVEGMTRALQDLKGDSKRERVIPILIHGDAALAGQGVVYETLQMNKLKGYTTGGTLHFVINNQIGFTTLPQEGRSTLYCTDIAKSFEMPVFHVNAEDPESCVRATLLAWNLRQKFHVDVFIDLLCYRKYGHNEGDEPAFTHPKLYQEIRKKKSIRELYRDQLIQEGTVGKERIEAQEAEFKKLLNEAVKAAPPPNQQKQKPKEPQKIVTAVDQNLIQKVATEISTIPEGFHLHPKIAHLVTERLEMVQGGKPIDWGMAETLAFATLLWEGKSIRLTGQDSCRGTFSHRHALLVDQESEAPYIPLQNIKKGLFEIYNSPLSENGALGFEFGYSVRAEQTLVIWEAQYGDFANGAQVVIDQYIVPSEQKWGLISALTLFLPHGYEGQGPEHSSARMERYLALAGDENMRIVNPTTPAQFFHLLRRQALDPVRKPLVVFTPKGLLRHPACISQLKDVTQGEFQEVLDDPERPEKAKRILFCSGRLYYDLTAERTKREAKELAIVRMEQLYPLPVDKIKTVLKQYQGVEEYLWVQEEPQNMGAWEFMHEQLHPLLPKGLTFVGRPRSAATAVGSHVLHKQQQTALIDEVFHES